VIAFATRLLIALLLLSSTGVVPAIARLAGAECDEPAEVGAAHDDGDEDCGDCTTDCCICICCPLRGAPVMRTVTTAPVEPHPQTVALNETIRVLPGITADIFHPPRV
jgi:hypothetical protein